MISFRFIKEYKKNQRIYGRKIHDKSTNKKILRDFLVFGMHLKISSFSAIDKVESFIESLYDSGDLDAFDFYLYSGILEEYRNILPELLQNATT